MQHWLERLSRTQRLWILVALDAVLLPAALLTAIMLRFGGWPYDLERYWLLLPIAPVVAIPVFVKFGLYRAVLRYMDEKVMLTVAGGVSLSVLLLMAAVVMFRFDGMPRSAIVIYWIMATAYIGASRYFARGLLRVLENHRLERIPVAIYGAGRAGNQLALALLPDSHYVPVAFFDDDSQLNGRVIAGIPVFDGARASLLVPELGIRQVLLAIPSLTRARKREIFDVFEPLHIQLKTVPDIKDLVAGSVDVTDVREVTIEELLGRDVVEPIPALMQANVTGKVVMVTGAGGSIGSELCRQILAYQPRKLVLFDLSEFALYQIDRELRELESPRGQVEIVSHLGSVVDQWRVEVVLGMHAVQTVYHAAAYKHVPLVEANPLEGVRNNVLGTLFTAKAAIAAGVETFVLISTDKAVRPTNIMGASKRVAEMVLQALASAHSKPIFSMVRFGNVLGSSGSVVPLFREQIRHGGPITLTHLEVTRYFMTIPEAAQLVIQAGAMAKGGEVFLLDMGEPVKIYDLARKMVHLSGLEVRDVQHPDGDIEIRVTGLRPGEKLYEELLIESDAVASSHVRILIAREGFIPLSELQVWTDLLVAGRITDIGGWISELVPEYQRAVHMDASEETVGNLS